MGEGLPYSAGQCHLKTLVPHSQFPPPTRRGEVALDGESFLLDFCLGTRNVLVPGITHNDRQHI